MSELTKEPYNGLTGPEVEKRRSLGQVNVTTDKTSRSLWDITRANVFTRFNALLSILFVIIMFVGHPIDGLFFIAVIINSGMGIVQELRAKHTLDKLTILNAPRVVVRRDDTESEIPSEEVVRDDLVHIQVGDQIPTDGTVIHAEGLEVDESLLTGEVDPLVKQTEDTLLSGSIAVAGHAWYMATAVGDDAYAHKLTAQAKKFTKARSELLEGTNKLLGYISIVILIVAPILIWGQLTRTHVGFQEALVRSIAAVVGMIPEGLVVLTSFAFVLASLSLSRRNVLVQELPAVEGLARVDIICLDKTGTLTEGKISFDRIEVLEHVDKALVHEALGAFAEDPSSPTLDALHEAFSSHSLTVTSRVAFSSKRKWSALSEKERNWVMGAPEIIFADSSLIVRKLSDDYATQGYRVLVLAASGSKIKNATLPKNLTPHALILLQEKVREDAAETLRYFADQGVTLKVISGDNPQTVAAVARRVGIIAEVAYDARDMPHDIHKVAEILESHNIFGRVLPEQKRLFIKALQSRGHVVAMTGDGVNDALALKDADIGIAMGNGAPATRAVARLVLLDNKFSHMPHVLAEGRRVIANIERVANLFVIKNVYNFIFVISVTLLALSFPFLPRHLSLISWLTIGIPAFFLALAPNKRRYVPGFLTRILRFAIPVGLIIALTAMYTYASTLAITVYIKPASSAAVISVVTIGLWVLMCLARPLKAWKIGLIATMALIFWLAISWPWLANILEFRSAWPYNIRGFAAGVAGALLVELVWRITQRLDSHSAI